MLLLAEAVDKYTAGLRVCPVSCVKDRAVLYANRGQMKRVLGLNDQEHPVPFSLFKKKKKLNRSLFTSVPVFLGLYIHFKSVPISFDLDPVRSASPCVFVFFPVFSVPVYLL